jgi:hypothetical protein
MQRRSAARARGSDKVSSTIASIYHYRRRRVPKSAAVDVLAARVIVDPRAADSRIDNTLEHIEE